MTRQVRLRQASGGTGDTGTSLLLRLAYGGQGGEIPSVAILPLKRKRLMVRQALKEVLAEDFPTFMGAKARQGVAARAKANLDGRNKNAKFRWANFHQKIGSSPERR